MGFVRHRLRWLFRKAYRREQQLEQDVQAYLRTLPTCHQFVRVAEPGLGGGEFFCGVILAADDLQAWFRQEAEQTVLRYGQRKVRHRALWLWLEQARNRDGQVAELPTNALGEFRGEVADWVKSGDAHVWCYNCESWVDDLAMSTTDELDLGPLGRSWTDLWFCGHGHKLYEAREEIRRIFVSAKT